jgi:signal transduction histidine kinase
VLAELFGPAVARRLLEGAPPAAITLPTGTGATRVLRPLSTVIADADGWPLLQVLLQDVTAEHQQQRRLDAYATSVLRGQEEERRRIAQELHDEPMQALVTLCRRLDALAQRHALPAAAVSALEPIRGLAEAIVQELRELAHGLRPPSLDDLGLVASLRQQVSRFAARTGTETAFEVQGDARRLPPDAELGLFRIAQEALRNVERHAAARRVLVGVGFREREVWLVVRDDGVGFTLPSPPASAGHADGPGLGLLGMRERAALLGGRLEVGSAPGQGTTVRVTVPAASGRRGPGCAGCPTLEGTDDDGRPAAHAARPA